MSERSNIMQDNNSNMPQKQKRTLRIRNILLGVLIAIVILFPTVLAVISIAYTDSENGSKSDRPFEVVIYSPDGKELFRENADDEDTGDSSLISIFNTIYNNKIPSEKISEKIVTAEPILVKMTSSATTVTFTCYFSFTEGSSYCIDELGNYYKILTDDSERFLLSRFAEPLYPNAKPPKLISADGDVILPSNTVWSYQNVDGNFVFSEQVPLSSGDETFHLSGGISFDFDTQPDECTVQIYDENELMFNGSPDALDSLVLTSDSQIFVIVQASWSQAKERTFYGSAEYSFNVSVHNRAEFFVSSGNMRSDGFIVVHATNVIDAAKLNFTSDIINDIPEFLLVGTDAYAIIPCPSEIPSSKLIDFTVSYGVSSLKFSIAINDGTAVSQQSLERTAELLGIASANVQSFTDRIFLETNLYLPNSTHFKKSTEYGETINVEANVATSCFTQYNTISGAGIPVTSIGAGKVVCVGQNKIVGNYVAVDMGLGLKIWYIGLSSADVYVGKYVAAGDIIGKSGTSQYSETDGFAIMLTFNNRFLNVECLLNNEF